MKSSEMHSGFLIGFLLVTSLLANPALAAEKKDKAARRAQQMVQQIQQEKAQLQSQLDQEMQAKAALEAEMAKMQAENSSLKGKLSIAKHKIDELEVSLREMTAERLAFEAKLMKTQIELESTRSSLNELGLQYKGALNDLKVNEQQRTTLTTNLIQKSKVIDACVGKNAKLYEFGLDLVKLYENPSRYEKTVLTEPFSQIRRVKLENILQDYNDKIDEQRAEAPK